MNSKKSNSSKRAYQAPSLDDDSDDDPEYNPEKPVNPNLEQSMPNFNQPRLPYKLVPGKDSSRPYTNPNFVRRIAEQNRELQEPSSAATFLHLSDTVNATRQDIARLIGTLRGNMGTILDSRHKQIPIEMEKLMEKIQKKLEIIPTTDADYDINNPDFFIRLAEDEDFKNFAIRLFDLRNEQMGRLDTLSNQIQARKSKETSSDKTYPNYGYAHDIIDSGIINEEINRPYSDAAIGIILASLLLSDDVDLTVDPQSDRDDLAQFLRMLKKDYFRETGKLGRLGGKRSKKIKYGRKRKTKRRRGTKKKSKRRHRTKRR